MNATVTPINWPAFVRFVHERGWATHLSPRGRLRLAKGNAVVFAPGPGAPLSAYADAIDRIGYLDGCAEAERRHGGRP
jgi:hypothetical protein